MVHHYNHELPSIHRELPTQPPHDPTAEVEEELERALFAAGILSEPAWTRAARTDAGVPRRTPSCSRGQEWIHHDFGAKRKHQTVPIKPFNGGPLDGAPLNRHR